MDRRPTTDPNPSRALARSSTESSNDVSVVVRYVFPALQATSLLILVGLGSVAVTTMVSSTGKSADSAAWGVDVTHTRPVSEFVRMHNTIATRTPFVLGDAASLPVGIGTEGEDGGVTLNRYVGASHALCLALNVEDFEDRYDFRVCTSTEVLALTAVLPMSSTNHVLTYASSDGDDYETGEVKHEVVMQNGDTYTYDFDAASPPPPVPMPPSTSPLAPPPCPPPPPSPRPPTETMQSFMGSDNEVNLGRVETNLNLVAYCCSGVYTHMTGEGPSRR